MTCSTPCTLESSREYTSSSSPPFSSTNATKMPKASLSRVRPASKNAAWTCLFTVAMVLRPSAPAQVTGISLHQSQQWCPGQRSFTNTAFLHTVEMCKYVRHIKASPFGLYAPQQASKPALRVTDGSSTAKVRNVDNARAENASESAGLIHSPGKVE
jgi:hypothetical protein